MSRRLAIVIVAAAAAAAMLISGCGGGSTSTTGAAIIGPGGGRVESSGYIVDIPPGALPVDILVTILPLPKDQLPSQDTPPGLPNLLAAARFLPDGQGAQQFAVPVSITFPLPAPRTPKEELIVFSFVNNTWTPTVFKAVVSDDGKTAQTFVDRFALFVLFGV